MAGSEVPSWWQHLQDRNVAKSMEYDLKKYLLLLATLVATVTYAAGLNLPGGSWQDDTPGGQVAGDSILRDTNYRRYIVFYCFNAISFAASLVVGLLLLVLHKGTADYLLHLLQTVMVLDLLCLVGAYAAGSSHDSFTTVCGIAVLASAVSAYATVIFLSFVLVSRNRTLRYDSTVGQDDEPEKALAGSEREMLLVLAIFAATIAYVAGLNPPGGFWRSTEEGHHTAGDPVLQALHPRRYRVFFVCNTIAFIASLLAIMLIVDRKKYRLNFKGSTTVTYVAMYVCILTALLGLGAAYAAGSCRDSKHTIYVLCLVAPVVACIIVPKILIDKDNLTDDKNESNPNITNENQRDDKNGHNDLLDRTRECVQLLATLAATIAYQAGVDPPGGVWSENGAGHSAGDPILLTTHHGRFEVFFYFNSAAFVASLVIMAMLQKKSLLKLHVLEKAIILDLFALVGAYAAGSCRDTSTSIYTVAMAGAVLIYVVIHIVFFTTAEHSGNGNGNGNRNRNRNRNGNGGHHELDEYREVLLLLAILAATLTYQAGLTPPGGFWENDDDRSGHRAGFPVLQDKYPRRYKAFFYCNAASFMASVALILLLLNANLYRPGIRCYALYVCLVAGMFGLMAAYAAGSSLHLRTSIISLALVIAVFAALVCLAIRLYHVSNKHFSDGDDEPMAQGEDEEEERKAMAAKAKAKKDNMMLEYLMLVGILGASVTYLTGLKPPGGLWREDGDGHSAGNPVLYDMSKPRYNAFFYSNSTSFVASIVVMALLLSRMMLGLRRHMPLWPMHTAMFLGMVGLLVAYAAGSARDACTSWKVIVLLVPIVGFVMCLFAFIKKEQEVLDKKTQEVQAQSTTVNPDFLSIRARGQVLLASSELVSQVGGGQ